ncbi:MAG: hypothetical protein ACKN9U_08755, partial [Pirellulaceae bacterium]
MPWAIVFGRVAANAPPPSIDAKDAPIGTQSHTSPGVAWSSLEWAKPRALPFEPRAMPWAIVFGRVA